MTAQVSFNQQQYYVNFNVSLAPGPGGMIFKTSTIRSTVIQRVYKNTVVVIFLHVTKKEVSNLFFALNFSQKLL